MCIDICIYIYAYIHIYVNKYTFIFMYIDLFSKDIFLLFSNTSYLHISIECIHTNTHTAT